MPEREAKDERRAHYRHSRQIPTRWRDNDVYHHINNVIYYEFFDTVINGYLMDVGGLDFSGGDFGRFCRRDTLPVPQADSLSRGGGCLFASGGTWQLQRALRDRHIQAG